MGKKEKIKASRSVHKTKCVDVPHLDALFKLVLSHEPDHVGHRGCNQNIVSAETIHVNNLEAPKRLHKMSINLCLFLQTPHEGRPLHKRGHNQSLSSRSTLSLLSKAAQTENQLQCFTATHKDKQRDIYVAIIHELQYFLSASQVTTRTKRHVAIIHELQYFLSASLLPTRANKQTCHHHPVTAIFYISIRATHYS